MTQGGGVRYNVECMVCHRIFTVKDISSPVPKHPREGEKVEPHMPYVPCLGSGQTGIPRGFAT